VGVTGDALIDLVFAVHSTYRSNGTFAMNSLTAASIRKLKDSTNQYVWQQGLIAGQPDRLLGYPVAIWEDIPGIAANAFCVFFGDFQRAYQRVDRTDIRILQDPHTTPGQIKFLVRRRVGGHVWDNHSLKIL
jgi:HK97 family phage major capsid protein